MLVTRSDLRYSAMVLSVFLLIGCAESPYRPYTLNRTDRVPPTAAPSTISITGLNEFPEILEKLSSTLTLGGLKVVKPQQANAQFNFIINKDELYAYDDKDLLPFRLGLDGMKVKTGREMMVCIANTNGRYKNITWTYERLPSVTPFFVSRPAAIEVVVNSKIVFRFDGEFIVSWDGKLEAEPDYFLYPDRITNTLLPSACLAALGHYELLKTGSREQKVFMLFWIGEYRCSDATSAIEEIIPSEPTLKDYCEKMLVKIK